MFIGLLGKASTGFVGRWVGDERGRIIIGLMESRSVSIRPLGKLIIGFVNNALFSIWEKVCLVFG